MMIYHSFITKFTILHYASLFRACKQSSSVKNNDMNFSDNLCPYQKSLITTSLINSKLKELNNNI